MLTVANKLLQNLQRKEHKAGVGGTMLNNCHSPDSDDDSQDGLMSPGPMTNGHQSYSSQQSLSNMTDETSVGNAQGSFNTNAGQHMLGGHNSNNEPSRNQSQQRVSRTINQSSCTFLQFTILN